MDGLTLRFVTRELCEALRDGRMEKVTQPEKDMLVILMRANGKNVRLLLSAAPSFGRVHLTEGSYQNPMDAPFFCMLMRKHLTGAKVLSIEQPGGDRMLKLRVESKDEMGDAVEKEIYLELMGRHSNLTLVQNGRIVDAIRHVTGDMSRVRQILPGLPFELPPEQDKLRLEEATKERILERLPEEGDLGKALLNALRGLSPMAAREIAFRVTGLHKAELQELDREKVAELVSDFLGRIDSLTPPQVLLGPDGSMQDVLPFPYLSLDSSLQKPMPSVGEAMDRFYFGRDRKDRMKQKSAALRHLIKNVMERDEKKLALQEEELMASAKMEEYRVCGELLTAQAYLVPRGAERVTLQNFYDPDGGSMEIELDVALTPAQNAQKYFKRYRKARSAQELAKEQKEKTQAEMELLEQALFDMEACETESDLGDVRRMLEAAGIVKTVNAKKRQKLPESRPMQFTAADGTEITVGKNSAQNDRITGAARGEETWLHAKDMPGSHVIIHSEKVSEEAMKTAAMLAAWYSKGHGVNVPVDYTLRKYVKKPGGSPAGFVIYTHQHTLQVSVTQGEIESLTAGNAKKQNGK